MAHKHTRHHKKREYPDQPREWSKQAHDAMGRRLQREERHRQHGLRLDAPIVLPSYACMILNGPHGIAKVRPRNGVALTANERHSDPTYLAGRREKLRAIVRQRPYLAS